MRAQAGCGGAPPRAAGDGVGGACAGMTRRLGLVGGRAAQEGGHPGMGGVDMVDMPYFVRYATW